MLLSNFIFTYGDIFEYPISFVNVDLEDQPLIYVNQAFMDLTGYSKAETLGRNCRFLQGIETDKAAITFIKKSISRNMPACQDILNYKKDNSPFFNRLVLIPFKELKTHYYLGFQYQISAQDAKKHHDIKSSILRERFQEPFSNIVKDTYLAHQMGEDISFPELQKRFQSTIEKIESFILDL
jgi:PAS domain-containing protein